MNHTLHSYKDHHSINSALSSESIYNEYKEMILAENVLNRKAAFDINEWLHHSSVCYHGRCVYTLQIPKIYPSETVACFQSIVETAYRIFTKIMDEYQRNPEYRKCFNFPEKMEKWILSDSGYSCALPIARFDIFFDEQTYDFKFCEINTDGTSAMNEDYVLDQVFRNMNPVHMKLKEKYPFKSWELYDSWVRSFMEIYSSYPKKKADPYIAIVDFLETGSITEFEEFCRRFKAAGYQCEVCEVTKLCYKNGVLYSPTGHPIDVIYRRVVTRDAYEHEEEIKDFLSAVLDGSVCMIGSFATQIIHNKLLFKIIQEEETLSLLTESEQEFVKKHFPYTTLLADGYADFEKILKEKDYWLIKPMDSYASVGVFAGRDETEESWRTLLEKTWNTDYIVQEYCLPYMTENIFYLEDNEFKPFTNMSGLFVYNGKFSGVYSRLSDSSIISSQYNERSVPSYYLD